MVLRGILNFKFWLHLEFSFIFLKLTVCTMNLKQSTLTKYFDLVIFWTTQKRQPDNQLVYNQSYKWDQNIQYGNLIKIRSLTISKQNAAQRDLCVAIPFERIWFLFNTIIYSLSVIFFIVKILWENKFCEILHFTCNKDVLE